MSARTQVKDLNWTPGRESGLERKLITEYLLSKGYNLSELKNLPKEQRKALMKEACIYAAIRLANIEAKSTFRKKINLPRYR